MKMLITRNLSRDNLSRRELSNKIQVWKNQRFLIPKFSKKSQLKIQEMAFMLVAVVLFFILVGLFVLSIFYMKLYEEANKIAEDRTLSAVTSLADSPEFSCSIYKSNCIDGDKLVSLINNAAYKKFLPFSSLRLIRFHAFDKSIDEMVECTSASYPDCDVFLIFDKGVENEKSLSSFVAFCRKEFENEYTYDKCEIAQLLAGTEVKIRGEG